MYISWPKHKDATALVPWPSVAQRQWVTWYSCFGRGGFLLCMSSSGTVQLAGILDQCSCGIPAEQTNMAACSLHMQMCPVSFTDASELSSSRSLRRWTSHSACQAHTYANNRHTHKRWLSKPNRKERHNRDKYVTASGLGLLSSYRESCCGVRKKTKTSAYWFWQSVCSLVPVCVCIIPLNLWKRNLNDSWLWCTTAAVLSPVNHLLVVFSNGGCVYSLFLTVIDGWKPSRRRPKTPLKGPLKSRNCFMLN